MSGTMIRSFSAIAFSLVGRFFIIMTLACNSGRNDGKLRSKELHIFGTNIGFVEAIPQIPAQWERCELNSCKNNGICFQDGTAEFCVCSEGYGGKQCERLIDSITLFDSSIPPATLVILLKLSILLLILTILAAAIGWLCCCMKHLNARRLYLANLKLSNENRDLHEQNQKYTSQNSRISIALRRVKRLCDAEFNLNDNLERERAISEVTASTNGTMSMNVNRAQIIHEIIHIQSDLNGQIGPKLQSLNQLASIKSTKPDHESVDDTSSIQMIKNDLSYNNSLSDKTTQEEKISKILPKINLKMEINTNTSSKPLPSKVSVRPLLRSPRTNTTISIVDEAFSSKGDKTQLLDPNPNPKSTSLKKPVSNVELRRKRFRIGETLTKSTKSNFSNVSEDNN